MFAKGVDHTRRPNSMPLRNSLKHFAGYTITAHALRGSAIMTLPVIFLCVFYSQHLRCIFLAKSDASDVQQNVMRRVNFLGSYHELALQLTICHHHYDEHTKNLLKDSKMLVEAMKVVQQLSMMIKLVPPLDDQNDLHLVRRRIRTSVQNAIWDFCSLYPNYYQTRLFLKATITE